MKLHLFHIIVNNRLLYITARNVAFVAQTTEQAFVLVEQVQRSVELL
jgi:hypothetical protein